MNINDVPLAVRRGSDRKLHAWLLERAIEKAWQQHDDYMRHLLEGIKPAKMTTAESTLINDYL